MLHLKDSSHCEAWYLVHCQPRKERYASYSLQNLLGLSVFFPEIKTRSRGETHVHPFFPGYIFLRANLQEVPLSRINATPGVIRLVAFGDELAPVPYKVINMISERLTWLEHTNLQPFQPGDIVRVKQEGPLHDLEMIFVRLSPSHHRVTVLLKLLGRLKEVQIEVETLEKVSPSYSLQ